MAETGKRAPLGGSAAAFVLAAGACATPQPSPPPTPPAPAAFHIVSLGDSLASGQGAPDDPVRWWEFSGKPGWYNERCNRSRNAGTEQAKEILRSQGRDVSHRSFACSGATIEKGLIGDYNGSEPEPNDPPLPPQVEELADLIADPNTNVDAVTISIGANDIFFGYLVAACTVLGWTDFLLWKDCTISKPLIDSLLASLGCRLDSLADELALLSIDPARILLVEYPNPAQDPNGHYCDKAPCWDPLSGIDKREATWAGEYVLRRINYKLCKAAERHGWTYVDDIAARFKGHGWCACKDRWINTIGDSLSHQGHARGGVHPNKEGHRKVGERLAEVIGPMITTLPTGTTDCGPEPEP